jgi:hypothetical protein
MWMVWLLWLTIVFGGAYMGLGALAQMRRAGFEPALALMAALYLATALYGLPRLLRLFGAQPGGGGEH